MAIKINEIARLKVTGEDCFTLDITGDTVTVRRPVMTRDGIEHKINTFTKAELLSPEDYRTNELAERMAMQQQILAANNASDHQVSQVQ